MIQEPLDYLVSQGNKVHRDHLAPEDRQDLREQRVILEQPEAKVLLDSRDQLGNQDYLEPRVHQGPKETRDQQEQWASQEPQVQRVMLDWQATEELKDQQDLKDYQEIVVALVAVDRPEMWEHLELLEALVALDHLVSQVHREIAVHQGCLAAPGNQVTRALRDNPDLPGQLDRLGRMES